MRRLTISRPIHEDAVIAATHALSVRAIGNSTLSTPPTTDSSPLAAPKPTLTTPSYTPAENTLALSRVFGATDSLSLAIQNA
jgi:hypothetical protein